MLQRKGVRIKNRHPYIHTKYKMTSIQHLGSPTKTYARAPDAYSSLPHGSNMEIELFKPSKSPLKSHHLHRFLRLRVSHLMLHQSY